MRYIDKTGGKGAPIIEGFLKRLKKRGKNYPDDLYEAFTRDRDAAGNYSKKELIKLLLKEQNHRCCYCMRRLNHENTTLEHIIPNKVATHALFASYMRKHTVLNRTVCFAPSFITKKEKSTPPYPHSVAYQNIAASCDGRIKPGSQSVFCCNLKRGAKFVEPIVLYPSIGQEILYRRSGRVVWINDREMIPTVNKLGLNDPILKMIRRILIYCKNNDINIKQCNRKTVLYHVLETFSQEDFNDDTTFRMLLNFQSNAYWNLLKEYNYFSEKQY